MKQLLKDSLVKLGMWFPETNIDSLLYFWKLLTDYNKNVNLISRNTTDTNGFIAHIVDSLCPMIFPFPTNLTYMDLGSGGGLPAIPLKIVRPGWKTVLVESTGKKAKFLKMATEKLDLQDTTVLNLFLDFNTVLNPCEFDLITTRGFATLDFIIPRITKFLHQGSYFLYYTAKNGVQEIKQSQTKFILQKYNLVIDSAIDFSLPFIERFRALILFRKL
ncbi:MAG: 16S rRNA (guanine(527)-N(7))-methyltransferase RsmG [Deltaproteobacteria bacterium]|jgi:16S rRNA (guanine527-N7)-methyltransferase|nr:16S rRNA (guanine(527)-N(7))-methyltransferase RsmG [Deltaproteobacteria bacterium]